MPASLNEAKQPSANGFALSAWALDSLGVRLEGTATVAAPAAIASCSVCKATPSAAVTGSTVVVVAAAVVVVVAAGGESLVTAWVRGGAVVEAAGTPVGAMSDGAFGAAAARGSVAESWATTSVHPAAVRLKAAESPNVCRRLMIRLGE